MNLINNLQANKNYLQKEEVLDKNFINILGSQRVVSLFWRIKLTKYMYNRRNEGSLILRII